jgi:hypothetical protein
MNKQNRYDIGGDMQTYEQEEDMLYWRRCTDIRTSGKDMILVEICRHTNTRKRYDIGRDMQTYEQAEEIRYWRRYESI